MSDKSEYIKERLLEADLCKDDADEVSFEKLVQLYDLLIYTNRYINLTRIMDFKEYVDKHIIDSLEVIHYLSIENVEKCIDIGSGGGFPGLPLAIVYPHMHVILVDSVGKKVNFINDVVMKLQIHNAAAVHARAENLARDPNYREQFDLCTSRAVARYNTLAELCIPFIKIGGVFAAYKSGDSEDEIREGIKAVKTMGGKVESENRFVRNGFSRNIVIVRKEEKTPNLYPRKAGTPARNPIMES